MVFKWVSLISLAMASLCSVVDAKQPNILVILTDDQDKHMGSVENMPKLQQYLVSQGATHNYHYCTVSQCCPSRVSMWTGRHAHNHNVTDVRPPYGTSSQVHR
jgi:N-acetylglucosamine-6-sulfatase